MRIHVITALSTVLLIAGLSACGGEDGGDSDSTAAAVTAAADTTSPAATAPDPDAALSCLNDAGLVATSEPGNTAIGSDAAIHIEVQPQNGIIIDFFDDPEKAESYAKDQDTFLSAGGGGSSEVVGETAVVGVARPGAEQELNTVASCLES